MAVEQCAIGVVYQFDFRYMLVGDDKGVLILASHKLEVALVAARNIV